MIISSPIAKRRCKRCRRPTTARRRWPTSTSPSRRRDVHLARMEEDVCGRHGHEVAAANNRLLHGQCRSQGLHTGREVFRPEPLSEDDRLTYTPSTPAVAGVLTP